MMSTFEFTMLILLGMCLVLSFSTVQSDVVPVKCSLYETYYCTCKDADVPKPTALKICPKRNGKYNTTCDPCPNQERLKCSACPGNQCPKCSPHKHGSGHIYKDGTIVSTTLQPFGDNNYVPSTLGSLKTNYTEQHESKIESKEKDRHIKAKFRQVNLGDGPHFIGNSSVGNRTEIGDSVFGNNSHTGTASTHSTPVTNAFKKSKKQTSRNQPKRKKITGKKLKELKKNRSMQENTKTGTKSKANSNRNLKAKFRQANLNNSTHSLRNFSLGNSTEIGDSISGISHTRSAGNVNSTLFTSNDGLSVSKLPGDSPTSTIFNSDVESIKNSREPISLDNQLSSFQTPQKTSAAVTEQFNNNNGTALQVVMESNLTEENTTGITFPSRLHDGQVKETTSSSKFLSTAENLAIERENSTDSNASQSMLHSNSTTNYQLFSTIHDLPSAESIQYKRKKQNFEINGKPIESIPTSLNETIETVNETNTVITKMTTRDIDEMGETKYSVFFPEGISANESVNYTKPNGSKNGSLGTGLVQSISSYVTDQPFLNKATSENMTNSEKTDEKNSSSKNILDGHLQYREFSPPVPENANSNNSTRPENSNETVTTLLSSKSEDDIFCTESVIPGKTNQPNVSSLTTGQNSNEMKFRKQNDTFSHSNKYETAENFFTTENLKLTGEENKTRANLKDTSNNVTSDVLVKDSQTIKIDNKIFDILATMSYSMMELGNGQWKIENSNNETTDYLKKENFQKNGDSGTMKLYNRFRRNATSNEKTGDLFYNKAATKAANVTSGIRTTVKFSFSAKNMSVEKLGPEIRARIQNRTQKPTFSTYKYFERHTASVKPQNYANTRRYFRHITTKHGIAGSGEKEKTNNIFNIQNQTTKENFDRTGSPVTILHNTQSRQWNMTKDKQSTMDHAITESFTMPQENENDQRNVLLGKGFSIHPKNPQMVLNSTVENVARENPLISNSNGESIQLARTLDEIVRYITTIPPNFEQQKSEDTMVKQTSNSHHKEIKFDNPEHSEIILQRTQNSSSYANQSSLTTESSESAQRKDESNLRLKNEAIKQDKIMDNYGPNDNTDQFSIAYSYSSTELTGQSELTKYKQWSGSNNKDIGNDQLHLLPERNLYGNGHNQQHSTLSEIRPDSIQVRQNSDGYRTDTRRDQLYTSTEKDSFGNENKHHGSIKLETRNESTKLIVQPSENVVRPPMTKIAENENLNSSSGINQQPLQMPSTPQEKSKDIPNQGISSNSNEEGRHNFDTKFRTGRKLLQFSRDGASELVVTHFITGRSNRSRRLAQDFPHNSWCVVPYDVYFGKLQCNIWTFKKVCEITCSGGGNLTALKCHRKKNVWEPKLQSCPDVEGNVVNQGPKPQQKEPAKENKIAPKDSKKAQGKQSPSYEYYEYEEYEYKNPKELPASNKKSGDKIQSKKSKDDEYEYNDLEQ